MKVTFNQSIQAMWGRMGGLVFRRSYNGRVVVAAAPDMSRVKWSDAQQAHRQRFKEAVAYARAAMGDETLRGKYSIWKSPPNKANAPSIWRSRIISKAGIYWRGRTDTVMISAIVGSLPFPPRRDCPPCQRG